MEKYSAIILAAGSGKRMGSAVAKQYLPLLDKPLVYYALTAFAKSSIDEIILVVAPGEVEYCTHQIVEKYQIPKVTAVIEGGQERYDSVFQGLQCVTGDYVMIHDGARAFVTGNIIEKAKMAVREHQACVVGMPVKDTIKMADTKGFAQETLPREKLWMVQTPQCFAYPLIQEAYQRIMEREHEAVTDDAMVVELTMNKKVILIEGSYENIKVTTPEDLVLGEAILSRRKDSE